MFVGDKIPLSIVLWDGNPTKFIKAVVRDGKNEIAGSPVVVPHNSYGNYYYKDTSLLVPDGAKLITVEYTVYDDPEMTVESAWHERAHDIFEVLPVPSQSEISDKLDNIITIVTSHGLNDRLIGHLSSDEVVGYIHSQLELIGTTSDDEILVGVVTGDEITGATNADCQVIGQINS